MSAHRRRAVGGSSDPEVMSFNAWSFRAIIEILCLTLTCSVLGLAGESGDVFSFGLNHAVYLEPDTIGPGQLGLGDNIDRYHPTKVPSLSGVIAVAAGAWHSLFLLENGCVYSCGKNSWGDLGLGDTEPRLIPTLIPGLSHVKAIAAGYDHNLVLLENGDVYSFGANQAGQLGYSSSHPSPTPRKVPLPYPAIAIAAGAWHSLVTVSYTHLTLPTKA